MHTVSVRFGINKGDFYYGSQTFGCYWPIYQKRESA